MTQQQTLTEQIPTEKTDGTQTLRPVLAVVYGPVTELFGNRLVLDSTTVAIGRNTPLFFGKPLNDPRISGHHADVTVTGDQRLHIVDQGSKNGTFVDEDRISEITIPHGGFVQFGRTTLRYLVEPAFDWHAGNSPLVGISHAMAQVRDGIRAAARHHRPVLIEGPSGSGKEPTAQEIHRQSGRSGRFVAVNCAALPKELMESELFGHAEGAFTGAKSKKIGLFAAAHLGTLFLDEFTEMPLDLQPKLLRAIQDGRIRAVGATEERAVDVRIVAATNRNALDCVKNETLRLDLYGRLRGGLIRTPALADRPEDIGVLSRLLLGRAGLGHADLSPGLLWALLRHSWPFNVRGLEHILLTASAELTNNSLNLTPDVVRMLNQERELLRPESLDDTPDIRQTTGDTAHTATTTTASPPDHDTLVALLAQHRGVVSKVAATLSVHRFQVYRWIRAMEIDIDVFR
ncbi:MAG: sigma 54-interacting transcriptional regulator [Myxococcales bacterium]|nr:sigma 54-interacting transcriptional regulator [Myxococcales bacterium]